MKISNIHKGYPGNVPEIWVNPYHLIEFALKDGRKVQWRKLDKIDKWYDYRGTQVNKDFSPHRYRIV